MKNIREGAIRVKDTESVHLRVLSSEKEEWLLRATELEMTLSTFIRTAVRSYLQS